VQVGEPLNGISEGLFIDLGVLGADTVADRAVMFMAEPQKTVIDECIIVIYDYLSSKDESETVIF
jgi:hypothetical protein